MSRRRVKRRVRRWVRAASTGAGWYAAAMAGCAFVGGLSVVLAVTVPSRDWLPWQASAAASVVFAGLAGMFLWAGNGRG